ncbi:MAG TPA: 2-oxoglutarate and iron-dependent oxygenase domain-containing protein, partial [Acidimicrobiales bacterium]
MSQDVRSRPGAAFTSIPVVDLSRWTRNDSEDAASVAAEVRTVCHQVGFFHLVGHGVPDEFFARWFDGLQRFFALPDETKGRIDKRRSRHFRGWEAVGSELTNNRTDYREQLDVSTENPPSRP